MATTVRVTGKILTAVTREGQSKDTGQPWTMSECMVFVASSGIADVRLPRDWALPNVDEYVDYLCEATPRLFNGNVSLSLTVLGNFPAAHLAKV